MRGLSFSCLLLAYAGLVKAQDPPDYILDITSGPTIPAPDGVSRLAVLVNGSTPGPTLSTTKGKDLFIQVNNKLNLPILHKSTSIHWHGLFQPRTAYDDGPAFVTQCPIAPNNSYLYKLETGDQAGTFWYHSHLSSQYIDGLRGALIIYDPEDPHKGLYDYDNHTTVIGLTDWYHTPSKTLLDDYLVTGNTPQPQSALLNGTGRYNDTSGTRAVVHVQKGKRYRFRVINMSALVSFNFGIQGHNLTVIEVDGVSHHALEVTSFTIHAGQRYSVVLNAVNEVDNYWIAYTYGDAATNVRDPFAILRYETAPAMDPSPSLPFTPDPSRALQEHNLVPLEVVPPPDPKDVMTYDLGFGFNSATTRFTINNVTYTPPTIPTLLNILTTGNPGENVYAIPINKTIDFILRGGAAHPFHLHGHAFQVIQSATGPRNEINPPIRDTVNTGGSSPVTIRFKTDNPGPWFLHCHKDWHLEAGLAAVFAEDIPGQIDGPQDIEPTPEWERLCAIYDELPEEDK